MTTTPAGTTSGAFLAAFGSVYCQHVDCKCVTDHPVKVASCLDVTHWRLTRSVSVSPPPQVSMLGTKKAEKGTASNPSTPITVYEVRCVDEHVVTLCVKRHISTKDLVGRRQIHPHLQIFFRQSSLPNAGKVHNPTGDGVRVVSSQVQAKFLKHQAHKDKEAAEHETEVKEEGSAKRNITRKKTDPRETGNYDSRNKKQGGHGKGKWKDDEIIYDEELLLDQDDPCYDEQQGPGIILSSVDDPESRNFLDSEGKPVYGPMLTQSEFKLQVEECLKEYFDSCDSDEVIRSIMELQCREFHSDVVKKAISVSLDKHPRERELVSRLLTCLHPSPLSDGDMEAGFDTLLDSLDDLTTDVPEAPTMVANFLARAVVDEVLPPAYLSDQNNMRPGDPVVDKAISLLSREHCTARLERVWGPGDGRPVSELKVEMDQMLQEYLMSRELDECARCVKELNSPHYMHELVKRGVKIAMEQDGTDSNIQHDKSAIDAMAALFAFLLKNAIISEHQVAKGISRLHKILDDLKLDVPAAPTLLESFESILKEEVPIESETKE
eukprot:scaffold1697_cov120-Cylindrotheca_fusiformis.AAC.10